MNRDEVGTDRRRWLGGLWRLTGAALVMCVIAAAPAVSGTAVASTTRVWSWGQFTGDTPLPKPLLSPEAIAIPGDLSAVVQVGSSNSASYALLADGSVWAWGLGNHGELGNGGTQNSVKTAVRVQFPPGVRIAFLATDAMPADTALAVDTNGNAWGWGANTNDSLCLGNDREYNTPVRLPLTDVTALAGASGHALYVANGAVYECGSNSFGVAGTGSFRQHRSSTPVEITALAGQHITAVGSSYGNDAALTTSGRVYMWGLNSEGQLGDGTRANADVPVAVTLPGAATQIAVGGSEPDNGQTVVLLTSGLVYGWGNNTWTQLDARGPATQDTPLQLATPAGARITALASGGSTIYAIDSAGILWSQGQSRWGQAGDGRTANASAFTVVASGMAFISATARNAVAAQRT